MTSFSALCFASQPKVWRDFYLRNIFAPWKSIKNTKGWFITNFTNDCNSCKSTSASKLRTCMANYTPARGPSLFMTMLLLVSSFHPCGFFWLDISFLFTLSTYNIASFSQLYAFSCFWTIKKTPLPRYSPQLENRCPLCPTLRLFKKNAMTFLAFNRK